MPASEAARRRSGQRELTETIVLAAAGALLFGVAFPGVGLWPLAALAPAPLAWLAVRGGRDRVVVPWVFALHMVLWLWLEHWMSDITVLGYPLLCAYLAVYPAAFVWLIRRLAANRRLRGVPLSLLVPVVWVGLECMRGRVVLGGYPWYLLGHPAVELPILAQSADLFGAYFTSFLLAAVSGAVVDLAGLAGGVGPRRRALVAAGAVGVCLVANLAYGAWRLGPSSQLVPGPRLLAIQTNLPQSNKIVWGPQEQAVDVPRFIELTTKSVAGAPGPPDLVIWPETMLPGAGLEPASLEVLRGLEDRGALMVVWPDALVELQGRLGVPILAGSLAWVGEIAETEAGRHWVWRDEYNSAYLIEGGPPYQRYDKVHLTPFGERMPIIWRWAWLEQKLLALGARGMTFDLSAADRPRRLRLLSAPGTALRLATPICFEVTVPWLCRRMAFEGGTKAADVFVNLSNDGWFGDSVAARRRHLQIARFRCIENRVPMVRAVNTGISAAIDSAGRVRASVAARTEGAVVAELELDGRSTVYGRLGDAFAWLCLGASLAAAATVLWRSNRDG